MASLNPPGESAHADPPNAGYVSTFAGSAVPYHNGAIAADGEVLRVGVGATINSHHVEHIEAATLTELFAMICASPSEPDSSGPYICAPMAGGVRNAKNALPTRLLLLDFDQLSPEEPSGLGKAIDKLKVRAVAWTTRSSTPQKPRLRVMVELSEPVSSGDYASVHAAFLSATGFKAGVDCEVDPSSARSCQPQFVPLASSEIRKFLGADFRPFNVLDALEALNSSPQTVAAAHNAGTTLTSTWLEDPLVIAAQKGGLHPHLVKAGIIGVRCPWSSEHTTESNESSSALLLPHYDGRESYGFKRLHAHCAQRGIKNLREFLKIEPVGAANLIHSLQPIAADWIDVPLPPQIFVLDGWIPQGTVGLLIAEGGTGKTLLSIRAAMSVAGGRDLFGIPTKRGIAVVLALEDPEDVLRRRVFSICSALATQVETHKGVTLSFGLSDDTFRKNLLERLICKSLVGSELHLIKSDSGSAKQDERVGQLIAALRTLGQIELLVLDPLSRLHGLEENDSSVGTALINAAERIAQEVGCAVLISHHTGKSNSRERVTDPYAARGSSALADAARTVLRLLPADKSAVTKYGNISSDELDKQGTQ